MSKHKKAKRRRERREKLKKCPAKSNISERDMKIEYKGEISEDEVVDLMLAPGAATLFFDENGKIVCEMKTGM